MVPSRDVWLPCRGLLSSSLAGERQRIRAQPSPGLPEPKRGGAGLLAFCQAHALHVTYSSERTAPQGLPGPALPCPSSSTEGKPWLRKDKQLLQGEVQSWDGSPHCRLLIWGAVHEARLLFGVETDRGRPPRMRQSQMLQDQAGREESGWQF